jgi:hypothetical protein
LIVNGQRPGSGVVESAGKSEQDIGHGARSMNDVEGVETETTDLP